MKVNHYLAILFLANYLMISCSSGDDEEFSLVGTNTSVADLSGNWNATRAVFDRYTSGPVAQTDVVAEGGTVTLNIQNTGRFTLTVTEQGAAPETTTGRLAFDEDLLVIFFDENPEDWEYFSITHSEPNLSISGGNGSAEWDFDGDGTEEPANVDFAFVRI